MNSNHNKMCSCGCQQNQEKYENHYVSNEDRDVNYATSCEYPEDSYEYEQKQNGEDYENHYVSNESMNLNEDKGYMSNESTNDTCNLTEYVINLPVESTRWQNIGVRNGSQDPIGGRVWISEDVRQGHQLNAWPFPEACRFVRLDWQTVFYTRDINSDQQFFIFYQTDIPNSFIIANLQHGRVMEFSQDPNAVLANNYIGSNQQIFRKINDTSHSFRLKPISNLDREIDVCLNRTDQTNQVTSSTSNQGIAWGHFNHRPITLPKLPIQTTLTPPRPLTNMDDIGDTPAQAPRAVEGSALIPAIAVNDPVIPVAQRMRESPYYVLRYNTYWHRVISAIIPGAGQTTRFDNVLIPGPNQSAMINALDISIGSDFRLQFLGNGRTNLFQRGIRDGLNILNSSTSHRLGDATQNWHFTNRGAQGRLAFFVKAHEFVLQRANGTLVDDPWVALETNVTAIQTFGSVLLRLEQEKIVCASNSYNLSVWKTPMEIKTGKIYTKNEWNTKPNYK